LTKPGADFGTLRNGSCERSGQWSTGSQCRSRLHGHALLGSEYDGNVGSIRGRNNTSIFVPGLAGLSANGLSRTRPTRDQHGWPPHQSNVRHYLEREFIDYSEVGVEIMSL